jgi:hypothetical protein
MNQFKEKPINELTLEVTLLDTKYCNASATRATRDCAFNAKRDKETNQWVSKFAKIVVFNNDGSCVHELEVLLNTPTASKVIVHGRLEGMDSYTKKNGQVGNSLSIIANSIQIKSLYHKKPSHNEIVFEHDTPEPELGHGIVDDLPF